MIKEINIKEISSLSIEQEKDKCINSLVFENNFGKIQKNKVSLKIESKSVNLFLDELAFVRIQTNQSYSLNWAGLFLSIVFLSSIFLIKNIAFPLFTINIFLFFIALTFSLFYKKYNYAIIVVLRVAQLFVIKVNKNDLPEAKQFVKELSSQII